MTQEDILRMAREAATEDGSISRDDGKNIVLYAVKTTQFLERFVAIVEASQREKVAHWMRSMGYATGHGDTIEDLLDHLGTQITERLLMERENGAAAERQRCARVARQWDVDCPNTNYGGCVARLIEETAP